MDRFASCCLLSYRRPQFIEEAVLTLIGNAQFPLELIVHDDGSEDEGLRATLRRFVDAGAISTLIENPPGHNQGVGAAMNRMFGMAQGDPIIKLDHDLIFSPGWLRQVVRILDRNRALQGHHSPPPQIGALGLFKYHHPPVRHDDMLIREHRDWLEVQDFVGSAIAIPRRVWREQPRFRQHRNSFDEDVLYKQGLQTRGYALGLPREDLAVNQGFGMPHSTVAVSDGKGGARAARIKYGPRLVESAR